MWCNKKGSNLVKLHGAHVCTLPRKAVSVSCIILIIFIVYLLFNWNCKKDQFIPSSTFTGAKKGYVFKNNDGKLGYHKD